MKATPRLRPSHRRYSAFTLVESVIAIGIFAFVIVGILGLFPAGMRRQAESGAEVRARIIAESIFESIKASDTLQNSKIPIEIGSGNLQFGNFIQGRLLGFGQDGTGINYVWPAGSTADWESGNVPPNQDITTKARILATPVNGTPNLYRVTAEIGSPANLPSAVRKTFSFTSYFFSPP